MKRSSITQKALVLTLTISFCSCAQMFQRRSFVEEMDKEDKEVFSPGEDFEVVGGDTGRVFRNKAEIMGRTPKTPNMLKRHTEGNSILSELNKKEENLPTRELHDYKRNEAHFEDDSEKIYYLNLTPRERIDYLKIKGGISRAPANKRFNRYRPTIMHNMDQRESNIYLGMLKDQVHSRWGKPSYIDIAGDPSNQNERWAYVREAEQS